VRDGEVVAIITTFRFGIVVAAGSDARLSCCRAWSLRHRIAGSGDGGRRCDYTTLPATLLVSGVGAGPKRRRRDLIGAARSTVEVESALSLKLRFTGSGHSVAQS